MNPVRKTISYVFLSVGIAMLALPASAAALSPRGIFGCNDAGAYSMSVGSISAMGGTFVPVSDAAVTLNTGYLVYKECVLRAEVNRLRENAIAQIVRDTTEQFNTGRTVFENGLPVSAPMYPVNLSKDMAIIRDNSVTADLNGTALNALSPAFSRDVKTTIYRKYQASTQNPGGALACSYARSPEDLYAVQHGKEWNDFNDVLMLGDSNCNPLYAEVNAENYVLANAAYKENLAMTKLGWNNGVYDVVDSNGNVVTPGFLVAGTLQQQLGAGFDMQKNANDIDQMLVSAFANIGNQILSGAVGGLMGLINNGGSSSLNQIVADSSAGLKDSAINAALQILIAAREIQSSYLDAENGTGAVLFREIARLRGAESSCWDVIIPEVKKKAATGNCTQNSEGGQTCTGSFSLKIATTTAFSQAVIDSPSTGIASLATTTALRITSASQRLDAVDELIVDVQNSKDPNAQSTALQQLDAMVAEKQLNNQFDLRAAEQQLQDVNNSITNLVNDTIKNWGDNANVNVGWCNVNNPAVIQSWTDKWKI